MPRFFVIGDESTVSGFGLAGVDGKVVETVDEARDALKKAFASPDIGIVIIPERLAAGMREDVEKCVFGCLSARRRDPRSGGADGEESLHSTDGSFRGRNQRMKRVLVTMQRSDNRG